MRKVIYQFIRILLHILLPMASIHHFKDIIFNTKSVKTIIEELGRTVGYIFELWGLMTIVKDTHIGIIIYTIGRSLHLVTQFISHRSEK